MFSLQMLDQFGSSLEAVKTQFTPSTHFMNGLCLGGLQTSPIHQQDSDLRPGGAGVRLKERSTTLTWTLIRKNVGELHSFLRCMLP